MEARSSIIAKLRGRAEEKAAVDFPRLRDGDSAAIAVLLRADSDNKVAAPRIAGGDYPREHLPGFGQFRGLYFNFPSCTRAA